MKSKTNQFKSAEELVGHLNSDTFDQKYLTSPDIINSILWDYADPALTECFMEGYDSDDFVAVFDEIAYCFYYDSEWLYIKLGELPLSLHLQEEDIGLDFSPEPSLLRCFYDFLAGLLPGIMIDTEETENQPWVQFFDRHLDESIDYALAQTGIT